MINGEEFKKIEEMKQAYKTLAKHCRLTLSFGLMHKEDYEDIKAIIENMEDFNDKENKVVARNIELLCKALPKVYYNEGNPNNGKPYFDTLEIVGDDLIVLRGRGSGISEEDLEYAQKIVDRFGKDTKADEHKLYLERESLGVKYYIIRLWWD